MKFNQNLKIFNAFTLTGLLPILFLTFEASAAANSKVNSLFSIYKSPHRTINSENTKLEDLNQPSDGDIFGKTKELIKASKLDLLAKNATQKSELTLPDLNERLNSFAYSIYTYNEFGDGGVVLHKGNLFIEGYFRRTQVISKSQENNESNGENSNLSTFQSAIDNQIWMYWNGTMYLLKKGSAVVSELLQLNPDTETFTLYRGMNPTEADKWLSAFQNNDLKNITEHLFPKSGNNRKKKELFFSPQLEGASVWTDTNTVLKIEFSKSSFEKILKSKTIYAGIEYNYVEVAIPALELSDLIKDANLELVDSEMVKKLKTPANNTNTGISE